MSGRQAEEVVWDIWDADDESATVSPEPPVKDPPPPVPSPPVPPDIAPPPSVPPVVAVLPALPPPPPVPRPEPFPLPVLPVPAPRRMVRGQRAKFSDLGLGLCLEVSIQLSTPPGCVIDVTCLGLDGNRRLSDERYFVFYNQKVSPCAGVALLPSSVDTTGKLRFQFERLPAAIEHLIVTVAIDGQGQMRALGASTASCQAADGGRVEFAFNGAEFAGEKALMLFEFYRKDGGWRVAALGQGFAEGLAALLTHFGAKVT